MLFLEFLLCSLIIFLLWIIPSVKEQIRQIHWIALLVTAIILGVVMVVEYFMQKLDKITIRFLLKSRLAVT